MQWNPRNGCMATKHAGEGVARGFARLFAFSIIFGVLSSAAAADEFSVRAGLKSEAARLLESGDMVAYDRRATELRSTRERTPAGIWKLSLFYKGPDNWPAAQPDAPIWTQIESSTEAYLRERPDSPSAIIAHARLLVSHAWAQRGSGWGRDLSNAQRRGFDTFLERAREVLDQHREAGLVDPEWYALRIQVMNGQNFDKAAILALAREALDHESTYQPLEYVTANALLPKWGGSTEQLQQFIALAIAKSSAVEGNQAYARIMFNIARADPKPVAALAQIGAQWPMLRASLAQIAAAYPDPWNRNAERAMACLLGTQADYDAALPRVATGLLSVAWFDSAWSWPECQQRQQRARESDPASWAQSFLSTPPSPQFLLTGAAGTLSALALVYFTRRRGYIEPTLQDTFSTSAASGSDYPRRYPVTAAWKAGMAILCGIFLLGALVAAWVLGVVAPPMRDTPQGLTLVFFLAAVAAGAAVYLVDTLLSVLVLQTDRLEIHELWRVRSIRREDMKSRQVLQLPNSVATLVLELKTPDLRRIKLPIMWQRDSTWVSWFAGIPDVDVEAEKSFAAAVSANPELGATPADRQQALVKARSIARFTIWANAGLVAWASLYPQPYVLVICVLLAAPWAAIWIMSQKPGVYAFNAPRTSPRPDLTILLITPGFLLTLRAMQDVQILDWQRLMLWAALIAIALIGTIVWAVPAARQKPASVALTLLLLLAYGYGAAALGNALLDRAPVTSYTTQVYGKHVTSGRGRTPEMRLGPWGPRTAQEEVTVPWEMYRRTSVGDKVCVLLRPGAFGIPWYRIAQCQ
jgi:hypothetical protein